MPMRGCSPVPLMDTVGWCGRVTGCARSFRRHPFRLRPTAWWEGSSIRVGRLCMGLHPSFTAWNTPHWFTLHASYNLHQAEFQYYSHHSLVAELEGSTLTPPQSIILSLFHPHPTPTNTFLWSTSMLFSVLCLGLPNNNFPRGFCPPCASLPAIYPGHYNLINHNNTRWHINIKFSIM